MLYLNLLTLKGVLSIVLNEHICQLLKACAEFGSVHPTAAIAQMHWLVLESHVRKLLPQNSESQDLAPSFPSNHLHLRAAVLNFACPGSFLVKYNR